VNGTAQNPFAQTSFAAQAVPHAPQFCGSDASDAQ